MENEIIKELVPLEEQAKQIEITSPETLAYAVSILSILNKLNDRITEEKERVTKPLNEALKAERSRWKPAETRNQTLIDAIRLKMTSYQTALVNSTKVQQESITARIAPGKGNLSLNTAIKKLESLPEVSKEVPTEEGLVQFREKQALKVNDISSIDDMYFDLNETRLLADLKAGKIVPGAEIEIIQVPVNYR